MVTFVFNEMWIQSQEVIYPSLCAFFPLYFFLLKSLPLGHYHSKYSFINAVHFLYPALLAYKIILGVKLLSCLAGHLPVRIQSLYYDIICMSLAVENIIPLYSPFRWSECTIFKMMFSFLPLSVFLLNLSSSTTPQSLTHPSEMLSPLLLAGWILGKEGKQLLSS